MNEFHTKACRRETVQEAKNTKNSTLHCHNQQASLLSIDDLSLWHFKRELPQHTSSLPE
jgi:hypothetical protein